MVKVFWWLSSGYVYQQEDTVEVPKEIWNSMTEEEKEEYMSDYYFDYLDWGYYVDKYDVLHVNTSIGLVGCDYSDSYPITELFENWYEMTEDEQEVEVRELVFDQLDFGYSVVGEE